MRQNAIPYWAEAIGSLVIAGVFLWSGLNHLANPYYFLGSIYEYALIGPTLGQALAIVVPVTQIIVGICLLGRVVVGPALLLSAFLLAVFTAAQASAAIRDMPIDCGCFGAASSATIGTTSLLQVGSLLAVALIALVCFLLRPAKVA